MTGSHDVIVIGAGIVGAACARACAAQGLKTLVVDASGVGGGATAAGMGHIVVMDDSPAQLALTRRSQQLWGAIAAEMPAEVEFELRGTLWVAADQEEMQEVLRKQTVYAAAGIETEVLDARNLGEAEPNLRPGLAGALRVPSDAVLYPPAAAAFLLRQAMDLGAKLLAPQRVVTAAGGQDKLKGKVFRIAHLGYAGTFDVITAVAAVEMTLKGLGHPIKLGSGVGAAEEILVEKRTA